MSLQSIISITGKPGLFKVVSQTKNGLVVESLSDKKRMPVHATEKVSAMEDISVYTYESDVPLVEVYQKMYEKTAGKEAISHKSKPEELRAFLQTIVEDFDQDRVYNSDLKKLFQWFNLLISADLLKPEEKEEKEGKKVETKKKPAAKKAPKPKAKPTVKKTAGSKKAVTKNTSSAKRG